jgi:hypothetical protein
VTYTYWQYVQYDTAGSYCLPCQVCWRVSLYVPRTVFHAHLSSPTQRTFGPNLFCTNAEGSESCKYSLFRCRHADLLPATGGVYPEQDCSLAREPLQREASAVDFAFFCLQPHMFLRAAWCLASLIAFTALAAQTSENTHQATARRASGANKIWVSQAAAGTVPKLRLRPALTGCA